MEIPLDDKAFRYYNVRTNRWEVEAGEYTLAVAASAAEVKLEGKLTLAGTNAQRPMEIYPIIALPR